MAILTVDNLSKSYPGFTLNHVSFSLEEGKITGFIGRNGAGKTTTLKSMLNFVHPDTGTARYFGKEFAENEREIKERLAFVSGGFREYPAKHLHTISSVTKRFYPNWDDEAYRKYMKMFALDEKKTPASLSEGMKVKYALTLALSHHASLLLLDEPTSGLDPVSRDELMDIFLDLVAREGVTILFSTHIITDLERSADRILYLCQGRLIADRPVDEWMREYALVHLDSEPGENLRGHLIGLKKDRTGYEALIKADDTIGLSGAPASLEEIMIHLEREAEA